MLRLSEGRFTLHLIRYELCVTYSLEYISDSMLEVAADKILVLV